jgi:hypothetical protein
MSRNYRNFVAAALGACAFGTAFVLRHPEALAPTGARFGMEGFAVAGAAFVLLAALSGILAMAARPHHAVGAFLFGVIPPAVCLVAGLPRFGVDPAHPRAADAVWLALSPVRHVADGVSADVVAREADTVAAVEARERETARRERRVAVDAAVAAVLRDANAQHEAALTAERDAAAAAERTRTADQAAQLEHERAVAREAVEARARDAAELATLREQLVAQATLEASVTELRQQLAVAAERREAIAREREDYRQLIAWFQADVPSDGPTPLRVLSRRLASTSAEERVVAARLLQCCGAAARPVLQRARRDEHPAVREAVETTLLAIER